MLSLANNVSIITFFLVLGEKFPVTISSVSPIVSELGNMSGQGKYHSDNRTASLTLSSGARV